MRFGFVIDHNRCIGCHACTVACKEEHNVPIGVNRTWVKYIEKGNYPDSKRYFGVLRCNHCDDAPCIEICPTTALFRRSDGIVDFDSARCIGCKSCMQACPYDALYIDPNTQTAAKCNFCAHRVEVGLEPACVIVCPEQAIIAGDLDDPISKIGRTVATQKVRVRKPEKETRPKLFYLGADEDLLHPGAARSQSAHLWADKPPGEKLQALREGTNSVSPAAPGAAREVYDVAHPRPWGSKITSYLWTKSIAAGILLVAAFLLHLDHQEERLLLNILSPVLALLFIAATILLLIFDLKRPERFYFLLTKPNPRSWLVLGGYILMLYGLLSSLWLYYGLTEDFVPRSVIRLAALFAAGSACYTAFLFSQAKGRDLWRSGLFFWHLLIHALVAGSAALIVCAFVVGAEAPVFETLAGLLSAFLALSLAIALAEVLRTHASGDARRAIEFLSKGPLRIRFWILAIILGIVLPLVFLLAPVESRALAAPASLAALAGLWIYNDLWIRAGQEPPLS